MAKVEQIEPGSYKVLGVVDFSTVTALLTQIHAFSESRDVLKLDFSGVERSNSAGLALLLELLAEGKKRNYKVQFTGIPETLMDLARMSNVDHLLTVD